MLANVESVRSPLVWTVTVLRFVAAYLAALCVAVTGFLLICVTWGMATTFVLPFFTPLVGRVMAAGIPSLDRPAGLGGALVRVFAGVALFVVVTTVVFGTFSFLSKR